jgi:beta-phosphoglucomutase-like phosphatase (HAD superfamily)
MIKAIFWDNDGVLVDTERLYFLATQQVLATVGIPLSKAQYIEFFLVQGKGAWHLAAENGVSPSAIEQLRNTRNTLYSRLLCQEHLIIDGVQEVEGAILPEHIKCWKTSQNSWQSCHNKARRRLFPAPDAWR